MRNTYYLLPLLPLFLLISTISIAQNKYDYTWFFSDDGVITQLDFSGDTIAISVDSTANSIKLKGTNSTVCDSIGVPLFYCNGVDIATSNHQIMENGEVLNMNEFSLTFDDGYNSPGATLALPFPNKDSLFVIFYTGYEIASGFGVLPDKILYALIDVSSNQGLGEVIEKDNVIVEDTLSYGGMTGVRHGNGRDWWVLIPEYHSNNYHTILLTPDGISIMEEQSIGLPVESGLDQAIFSPDGTKYARNNIISGLTGKIDRFEVYDFDRCTGLLNNHQQFMYGDSSWAGGAAISPNSRFLYVSHYLQVLQYDLWANDIAASVDTVAIYDGFESPFATRFFMAQLAPDNKIYLNSSNSVDVLHVIHNPNEKGAACNFEQHGIQLPHTNSFSLPNNPFFRLGALEGSPCDTLSVVNTNEQLLAKKDINIYPNPTTNFINIQLLNVFSDSGKWFLYNQLGQIVNEKQLNKGQASYEVSLGSLAKGIYFYSVFEDGVVIDSGKLILE